MSAAASLKAGMVTSTWLRRRAVAAASVLGALTLCVAGVGEGVETAISDYWHRQAGQRVPARHVALVVIDEPALATQPGTPLVFWTRQVAQAVEVLRRVGATAVGLDLMFSVSPESWLREIGATHAAEDHDRPLREVIGSGSLVMVASAANTEDGKTQLLLPAADLVLSVPNLDLARHMGLADMVVDADGAVRRLQVAPPLQLPRDGEFSSAPRLGFAALLALHAMSGAAGLAPLNPDQPLRMGARSWPWPSSPEPIAYAGPPGTVTRVSFADLMGAQALDHPAVRALKGKVVIIGAEYRAMNDVHATPYSTRWFGAGGSQMTGPEIQAQIVEMLISGRQLRPWPLAAQWAAIGALVMLAVPLFWRLPLQHLVWTFPLLAVISAVFSWQMHLLDMPFPLFATLLALTLFVMASLAQRVLGEEAERRRIQRLFGRYVSAPVVEQLVASGQTPPLGGTRQEISVLFSDVRNFTTLSERLQPEEVVELLNRYFSMACDEVLKEGGTIDKFIGDAIMVEFGTPVPHPDHADRAMRSALALTRVAHDFDGWMKVRFAGRSLPTFDIGVGVHTGPAVVGSIGSEKRAEYTAIGDTVNAASRIEGWTKEIPCGILVSEQTLQASRGHPRTGRSQEARVKGKDKVLVLHELLDWQPTSAQS